MAKYRVSLTYTTTRRNENHAMIVDAADATAAEAAAVAAVAARAPHLATFSMTLQAGLTVVAVVT